MVFCQFKRTETAIVKDHSGGLKKQKRGGGGGDGKKTKEHQGKETLKTKISTSETHPGKERRGGAQACEKG